MPSENDTCRAIQRDFYLPQISAVNFAHFTAEIGTIPKSRCSGAWWCPCFGHVGPICAPGRSSSAQSARFFAMKLSIVYNILAFSVPQWVTDGQRPLQLPPKAIAGRPAPFQDRVARLRFARRPTAPPVAAEGQRPFYVRRNRRRRFQNCVGPSRALYKAKAFSRLLRAARPPKAIAGRPAPFQDRVARLRFARRPTAPPVAAEGQRPFYVRRNRRRRFQSCVGPSRALYRAKAFS